MLGKQKDTQVGVFLFWKGYTNSMPFKFSTYMFEPLHVFSNSVL